MCQGMNVTPVLDKKVFLCVKASIPQSYVSNFYIKIRLQMNGFITFDHDICAYNLPSVFQFEMWH